MQILSECFHRGKHTVSKLFFIGGVCTLDWRCPLLSAVSKVLYEYGFTHKLAGEAWQSSNGDQTHETQDCKFRNLSTFYREMGLHLGLNASLCPLNLLMFKCCSNLSFVLPEKKMSSVYAAWTTGLTGLKEVVLKWIEINLSCIVELILAYSETRSVELDWSPIWFYPRRSLIYGMTDNTDNINILAT